MSRWWALCAAPGVFFFVVEVGGELGEKRSWALDKLPGWRSVRTFRSAHRRVWDVAVWASAIVFLVWLWAVALASGGDFYGG